VSQYNQQKWSNENWIFIEGLIAESYVNRLNYLYWRYANRLTVNDISFLESSRIFGTSNTNAPHTHSYQYHSLPFRVSKGNILLSFPAWRNNCKFSLLWACCVWSLARSCDLERYRTSESRRNAPESLSQVAYHRMESVHDIRKWVPFVSTSYKVQTTGLVCFYSQDIMLQTCFHLTTLV
jgi:hypothetical protein